MRKIVATVSVSLDGVMQGPGTPEEDVSGDFKFGGWIVNYFDEVVTDELGRNFSEPFDLLLGRRTYDIFAGHWPVVAAKGKAVGASDPEIELGRTFDRVTKYVATHTPETLTWANSEALGSNVVARLKEIKASKGPRLLVQGSSELLHLLLENDLVEEFRLQIFPVVLGKGKKLFTSSAVPSSYRVVKSAVSPKGVIVVNYERAGQISTGSFGLTSRT